MAVRPPVPVSGGEHAFKRPLGVNQVFSTKKNGTVHQRIKLIDRLAVEEAGRQGGDRLISVVNLRRLLRMQRQHGKIAFSVTPVAGRVEDVGAVRAQRAVIGPQIAVKQRRLRLVGCQTLLNVLDNRINIAKFQPFLGGQLKLPADALLGKKCRPAALLGVGLWRGGEVVVKIETKLRLVTPLMQARELLPEDKRIMGIQRSGGEIFHDQETVVAVAPNGQNLRDRHRFTARQQLKLVGFGGKYRKQFTFVAFNEEIASCVA